MKKADYLININDSLACREDMQRWQAARDRFPVLCIIYELQHDISKLEKIRGMFTNASTIETIRIFCEQGVPNSSEELQFTPKSFSGYVRRILQQKDRSYYIEART